MSRWNKLRHRRKVPHSDNVIEGWPIRPDRTLADVWERSCGNKIPYATRLDALCEALCLEEQHRKPFNVYPCGCCGQYHVGSES